MAKAIVNYVGDLIEGEGEEPETEAAAPDFALKVEGMMCGHCTATVEQAISQVPGVTSVTVDLDSKLARVCGGARLEDLLMAVKATGKQVEAVPVTVLRIDDMIKLAPPQQQGQ